MAKFITIIVLIILSAVTIKTVTDLKIIEFAIKGTEDYSKAQDKEMEEFGKIENLLTDSISNIQNGNGGSDLEAPEEPEKPAGPIVLTQGDIGKYVNYVPDGTDYTAESKYSGNRDDQTFKQDTNLKWQIWKVENDTIHLISEELPKGNNGYREDTIYLSGAQGYNNAVTLLDNICQTNYGIRDNNNVKARNLKLEDILEVKAENIENEYADKYEKQEYTYPQSGTFEFPSIWYNKERESLSLAQNNRSRAYELTEESNRTISGPSQKPYYTLWNNHSMNIEEAWKNEKYYNMVIGPAEKRRLLAFNKRCKTI